MTFSGKCSDYIRKDFSMNTYNCILELSNKAEWLQHISNTVNSKHAKCPEELLKNVCSFDFKFDTILQ